MIFCDEIIGFLKKFTLMWETMEKYLKIRDMTQYKRIFHCSIMLTIRRNLSYLRAFWTYCKP